MGRTRMGRTDGRTDGRTRRRLFAPPKFFGEHNKTYTCKRTTCPTKLYDNNRCRKYNADFSRNVLTGIYAANCRAIVIIV